MRLSLIVAVAENGVIGCKGKMPWRLSTDLRRFRKLTMGHHVIMGRKTFESIGNVLSGRTMVVLTHNGNYDAGEAIIASNLGDALNAVRTDDEPFIIGGGEVFSLFLPRVDRIYQTVVHSNPCGDTFFPNLDESQWTVVEEQHHQADEKNSCNYTFRVLDRKRL